MHANFLSNGTLWKYLWLFGCAKCAIFKLRLQTKYNNFLPNRIIASNIGFQRPVTSSLRTAFTRIVVGPTNLKRQKRRSLRSGESNGMQYVWVKALVFTNTPDNQRVSCSVFSVSSYILVLRFAGFWLDFGSVSLFLHGFCLKISDVLS